MQNVVLGPLHGPRCTFVAHTDAFAHLDPTQLVFRAYFGPTQTDLDSVMLSAAVVLVLASLTLPRRPTLSTRAFVPLLGAALPAVGLPLLALLGGLSSADLGGALIGARSSSPPLT